MISCYTICQGQNKTAILKKATSEGETTIISRGPSSIARTIKQDRKGNIWIASWEGVFRYDGKSFVNITKDVSSARFFSVLEDRKGNFWFASVGSGVYYYDGNTFENFTSKDGLSSDRVTNIYEDKNGIIWFGTEGGASRYDGKSFQNYRMNGTLSEDFKNDDNDVNSIIEDKSGKFWFGTRGNACVYDGKKFVVVTHNGKPFTNVRTIIEDRKGNIWLGGKDGLWRYDGTTFSNFTTNFVGYIYEDKKENVWISSVSANHQGWALSRYDKESLYRSIFINGWVIKPAAKEIKSNERMIFGILEANDESIWFGTLNGVSHYNGKTFTNFNSEGTTK